MKRFMKIMLVIIVLALAVYLIADYYVTDESSLIFSSGNEKDGHSKEKFYIDFVTEVAEQEEQDQQVQQSVVPGLDPSQSGNGGNSHIGIQLSDSAEEVKQKLLNTKFSKKADSMAMIYDVVTSNGGSVECAIGFMYNSSHEGNYGLVQYGMTVKNWDGPGANATSYQTDPLIITTKANIDAVEATGQIPSNKIGYGIVQWTYYTRVQGMVRHYRQHTDSNGDIDADGRAAAERAWFLEEYNAYVAGCEAETGGFAAGSAEAWTYGVCVVYENPKNPRQTATNRANGVQELVAILGGS